MRKKNEKKYGNGIGPVQPYLYEGPNGLKSAVSRFIHNRCEGLRFDEKRSEEEAKTGTYQGTAVSDGQVPYNMQMDTDRLCLERALERFLDSGIAEDAFDVYYCYIEMFIGKYENAVCRRMVEKLSEFEANGSSLLMKHRDHYSHSVYVFALGLAIFESNEVYRGKYKVFYEFTDDTAAAHHFLEYWGLSSLFHDIGYAFELPFEQIESYFESSGEKRRDKPFISFNDIRKYITFDKNASRVFNDMYGIKEDDRDALYDSNDLFALDISNKLGKDYMKTRSMIRNTLDSKPANPDSFGYFMDHAFFSASVLLKTLCDINGVEKIDHYHIDALTAIILHNSLYKFAVRSSKSQRFKAELHPLAYMLMMCDEFQCWDRTSYGRNSRTELHAMDCEFRFSGDTVTAVYLFDKDEYDRKINDLSIRDKDKKKLSMEAKQEKIADDVSVVDTSEIKVEVRTQLKKVDDGKRNANKNLYLSQSNFIHLYNFAVALNGRYSHNGKENEIEESVLESEFDRMSLEYKLSNIGQAKAFAKYLDKIDCLYTDRPVVFPMLTEFSDKDMDIIGPLEHERWLREHIVMGWTYSDEYTKEQDKKVSKALREQTRGHELMLKLESGEELTEAAIKEHYDALPSEEQNKDTEPMKSMLELIRKFDGLRIYRYKGI